LPTSIYDAGDNDIWPDASDRPPPAMREEIRQVAQIEITEQDIESLSFAPWYAKFYVAEQRVRRRIEAAKVVPSTPLPVPAAGPGELQQLRRRMAKLEKMVLGENAILLKAIGTALGEAQGELERRIAGLERQLNDIEQTRLRFMGVHEPGRRYSRGVLVVRNGSLWHCNGDTSETPGRSNDWQLAVKQGEARG
jgi:hypothetical protein